MYHCTLSGEYPENDVPAHTRVLGQDRGATDPGAEERSELANEPRKTEQLFTETSGYYGGGSADVRLCFVVVQTLLLSLASSPLLLPLRCFLPACTKQRGILVGPSLSLPPW